MALTRADLECRRLQQMIAQSGLDIPVLSEIELQASIDKTLQRHPVGSDVWLFAYGSLIWNPAFRYVDRHIGTIYGWHRRFCVWAPLGRGTPENPGLVLGLERGGSCRGVVYRIAAADLSSELLLLWRREMVVGSYIPRWVRVQDGDRTVRAIAFTSNPQHPSYTGKLPLSTVVRHLATARGAIGSAADYLTQTVEGLHSEGIRDHHLFHLCQQISRIEDPLGTDAAFPRAIAG